MSGLGNIEESTELEDVSELGVAEPKSQNGVHDDEANKSGKDLKGKRRTYLVREMSAASGASSIENSEYIEPPAASAGASASATSGTGSSPDNKPALEPGDPKVAIRAEAKSLSSVARPRAAPADSKAAIRAEANAVKSGPGAFAVGGDSKGVLRAQSRPERSGSKTVAMQQSVKNDLRAEAASLRTGPGAISVPHAASKNPKGGDRGSRRSTASTQRASVASQRSPRRGKDGSSRISVMSESLEPGAFSVSSRAQHLNDDESNLDESVDGSAIAVNGQDNATVPSDSKAALRAEVMGLRAAAQARPNARTDNEAKAAVRAEVQEMASGPGAVAITSGSVSRRAASTNPLRGRDSLSTHPELMLDEPSEPDSYRKGKEVSKSSVSEPGSREASFRLETSQEKLLTQVGIGVNAGDADESGDAPELPRNIPDDIADSEVVSAMVVDEEALEAEFQKKMMATMATAEAVDEEELKAEARRFKLLYCLCPLLLVGIALAIVLPLTREDPPSPTPMPTVVTFTDLEYLQMIFEDISGEKVKEEGTPQFRAANWLANEDGLALPIQQTNTSTLVTRYALAVLYYSTGGEYWVGGPPFLTNTSVCEWKTAGNVGVRTCNVDGLPDKLRFEFNNMTGTLPDELFELPSLVSVAILFEPSLAGTIPSNLGNLPELRTLQFVFTSMTGPIPTSSAKLSNLVTVNFFSNQFTGTLPTEILSLRRDSLRNGIFSRNMFSGSIPEFFQDSPMELLDVENNLLSGSLPSTLSSLRDLRRLIFNDNMINGALSASIGGLEGLVILDGTGNDLEGSIPEKIELLTDLESLALGDNDLTGPLPSELKELGRLTSLDLSSNSLEGTIPSELAELRDLVTLILSSNQLTGDVPSELRSIPSLSTMSLEFTDITGGLESGFCNQSSLGVEIQADCGGDPPEVECSCCTACCDGDNCALNLLGVCEFNEFRFGQDEERNAQCTCSENGSLLQCTESCESCNLDGTVCVRSLEYGHTLDSVTGQVDSFFNTMEYVLGRNETVHYFRDYREETCEVEVNGEKCRGCGKQTCAGSDLQTFSIDCSNIDGGFMFGGCTGGDSGYLELFLFEQPAQTSGCTQYLFNPDRLER